MTFRFNGDIQKIESPSPLEIYQKLKTMHWLITNLTQLYDSQYYHGNMSTRFEYRKGVQKIKIENEYNLNTNQISP